MKKITMIQANKKMINVLRKALELPAVSECYYCKKKIYWGKTKAGILPGKKKGELARVICDSPLCTCEWLDDYPEIEFKKT